MRDLMNLRKMRANAAVYEIANATRGLLERLHAFDQNHMPCLDWQDEEILRQAIENLKKVLEHNEGLEKKLDAA